MITEYDRLIVTRQDRKAFQRDRTLMQVTEAICGAMEEKQVTRTQLARKLGTTKGSVSQMLNGDRNLTLNSVSDMLFELDMALEVGYRGINDHPYSYKPLHLPDSLGHDNLVAQVQFQYIPETA